MTTASTTSFVSSSRARSAELGALIAVSLPFLFAGLGLSFLDPDEGLYGAIAREMLARRDWVLPHFNGLPYLEKPPLFFWIAAAWMAVGVPVEWATRLPSALAAFGSVLLTWRMGRRLYGRTGGLMAGIALATTAGYVLYVRKASTDLLLVFAVTLAMYGVLRDVDRRVGSPGRFLLVYVGLALGLLSKGLIGAAFPLLIIGTWVVWERRLRISDLNVGRGVALALAIGAPWHIAALARGPSLFWFYVADNQILRFLNRRAFLEDDVPISTLGFLIVSFLLAFPWSVFVLARPATETEAARSARRLLLLWAGIVVVFFALSRSKLEYYALPAFPALALMAGAAWSRPRHLGRWLVLGAAGSALVAVWLLVSGARLTPSQALDGLAELNVYYRILRDQGLPLPFASPRPFGLLLQALGLTLLGGWTAALICWMRGRPRAAFGAIVLVAAGIAVLIFQLLRIVEPHHSVKAVAAAISAQADAADIVVHEGSLEYSAALPLYTERRIVLVNGRRGDLEWASSLPEAVGVFLDGEDLVRLWGGARRVFVVTQRPRSASVIARLPDTSVHDLGTFGSRRLFSNR